MKQRAKVKGRLHDSRHTLITELAEGGVGDETIMNIAGHVSRQMLKHYRHIRMEAKRNALELVVKPLTSIPAENDQMEQDSDPVLMGEQKSETASLQKPLQSTPSNKVQLPRKPRK